MRGAVFKPLMYASTQVSLARGYNLAHAQERARLISPREERAPRSNTRSANQLGSSIRNRRVRTRRSLRDQ